MNISMRLFTIYWNPLGYPGKFVLRSHLVENGIVKLEDEIHCVSDSKEECRKFIPLGMAQIAPSEEDECEIMETWI